MTAITTSALAAIPANRQPLARRLAIVCLLTLLISAGGCTTLGGIAASKLVTAAGLVSLATTGKGLADHALDLITQKDCRILDGLLREERSICEPHGSLATLKDFRGLIHLGEQEQEILAETSRYDTHNRLTLELSNVSGRSAGDVTGNDRPNPVVRAARLELDTRLDRNNTNWTSSERLASVNMLMTVLQ